MSVTLFTTLVIGSLAVPARADTDAFVKAGWFNDSPAGFVGCVSTYNYATTWCFEFDRLSAVDSRVHVVAKSESITSPSIEEAVLPASALEVYTDGLGNPALKVSATLALGVVQLDIHTFGFLVTTRDDQGCPLTGVQYVLVGTPHTNPVAGAEDISGTVAGHNVTEINPCGSFFVGPTTGVWRFAQGL